MFRHEEVTSFSEIRLKISGMRITEVYEIICRPEEAELSLYQIRYDNREDKYDLQRRASVPCSDFIDVLNQCGVMKWDGFSGKNPIGVRDGTMFDFTATVNGGKKLYASGSNNYPRHYREFTDALNRILRGE